MLKDRVLKELDGGPRGVMAVVLANGVRNVVAGKSNRHQRFRFEPDAERRLKAGPGRAVQLFRTFDGQSAHQDGEPPGDKLDAVLRANDADMDNFGASSRGHGAIEEKPVLGMFEFLPVPELQQRFFDEVRLDGHSPSSPSSSGSGSSMSPNSSSSAALGTMLPCSSSSLGKGGSVAS